MSNKKLWGGRFTRSTSPAVERFTHSFDVDRRLARCDLLGSIAHARMLGKTRVIPPPDAQRILRGLKALFKELERGRLTLDPRAEDIHTALQNALERRVGRAAHRLHTARSRNDQAVTSLRLYAKGELGQLQQEIRGLQKAILRQAESALRLIMPGYTHLRHAQPVGVAHVLASYLAMLQRDRNRLADAARRLDELPLGSAALTGTSLPIDRRQVARELGFAGVAENSVDAVTERDFVVEILSGLSITGIHLARIAEDLILWSTAEFGFVRFKEQLLTGSSMMPQKQNPDFLELIRAGSARLIGCLSGMLALVKGLPSGYQRDLQLDKAFLFEALDEASQMLVVLAEGVRGIQWDRENLARQLQDEALYATDLAEHLVRRGVPFSEAHRAVGRLLAYAARRKASLRSIPLSVWRRFSPAFAADAQRLLDPSASVGRKQSLGGTHPRLVRQAIRRWGKRLHAPV